MTYRFGDYVLDTFRQELRKNGTSLPLEPKSYRMLVYFVASGGRLIGKEELLKHVWLGVNVDETAVRRCIRNIRRALGENRFEQGSIETRHGRGYRFLPQVTTEDSKPANVTLLADLEIGSVPDPPEKAEAEPRNSLLDTAILISQSPQGRKHPTSGTGPLLPNRPEVFLDVHFGTALALRNHPRHLQARELAEEFQLRNTLLVTTRTVLLEVAAQISEVLGTDAGLELLDASEDDDNLEIVPISDELYAKARRFAERHLETRIDQDPISNFILHQRDIELAFPQETRPLPLNTRETILGRLAGFGASLLIGIVVFLFSLAQAKEQVEYPVDRTILVGGATLLGCIVGTVFSASVKLPREENGRILRLLWIAWIFLAGFLSTQLLIAISFTIYRARFH